jgi:C-terminal processing protease CtpA/Prc
MQLKYKNIIFVFLLLFPLWQNASGKWKVVRSEIQVIDTLYSITNDLAKLNYQYNFYTEDNFEKVIHGGIYLNLDSNSYSKQPSFIWQENFQKGIDINRQNLGFYFNLYTKSIDYFEISVHDSTSGFWYKRKYNTESTGYQRPFIDEKMLSEYTVNLFSSDTLQKDTVKNRSSIIDKVCIRAYPKDEKARFVIGEFLILKVTENIVELDHPRFDEVLEKAPSHKVYKSDYKGASLYPVFSHSNIWGGSNLKIIPDTLNNISEREMLLRFFKMCIDYYPFYQERKVKKKEIENLYQKALEKSSSMDVYQLANELNDITLIFNDGHFKIKVLQKTIQKTNKFSPIRIKEINKRYYVAAVFDPSYDEKGLLVGQRINKLDHILIQDLLDSLSQRNHQNNEFVLNQYVSKESGDSLFINVSVGDRDSLIIVDYDKKRKLTVPSSFISKHGDFKMMDQGIAYFRLNNFIPGDYIRFLNYADTIKRSNGIIFDLRGNGGGNSGIAMQIFSLFIKNASIYSHAIDMYGNRKTCLVKPNPFFTIDQPLVILVDKNTACASEAFAEALRYNGRGIILGKETTIGAFANLYELLFPSGIILKFNSLSDIELVASGKKIENEGIEPDIWIDIMEVEDLYPFKDKCLWSAINFLSKSTVTVSVLNEMYRVDDKMLVND